MSVKATGQSGKLKSVRPLDLQVIGTELAIKWDDGAESFIALEALRRRCPCAGCMGEKDIMGNVYKNPAEELGPRAFQLTRINTVGGTPSSPCGPTATPRASIHLTTCGGWMPPAAPRKSASMAQALPPKLAKSSTSSNSNQVPMSLRWPAAALCISFK